MAKYDVTIIYSATADHEIEADTEEEAEEIAKAIEEDMDAFVPRLSLEYEDIIVTVRNS